MIDDPPIIFAIYLFYGGAFFAVGVAVVTRLQVFTKLGIAGTFWLLALFAFSHGLHEWMEMFIKLEIGPPDLTLRVYQVSMVLLVGSFVFLYLFGLNLHRVQNSATAPWLSGLMVVLTALFISMLLKGLDLSETEFLAWVDWNSRNFFAVPGTILTGSGFLLYAHHLQTLSRRGAGNFIGAGLAFLVYGILAGLLPSDAVLGQLPVQFWRGLAAFIILHFIMHALHIFLEERDGLINERLQRASREEKLGAVGRLAAGIAHEVNTPLANASLQLDMLRRDAEYDALPDGIRQRLHKIERSLDKSSRIAGELLSLTDQRQPDTFREPVKLAAAADNAWQELKNTANHRLVNQLDQNLAIYGLPRKIEQLFSNLLRNAIDATPEGGAIIIQGSEQRDRIVVRVLDTGEGINAGNQQLLLEPFYTTKAAGKGVGLGLAICHGIMAQHDGTLEIAPRRDTPGAMVTLVFPRPDSLQGSRRQGGIDEH